MADNHDYLTIEEMAALHGVTPQTVRNALWADSKLPEAERRLPGAFKQGSKYRGEWRIPRAAAEAWRRDPRGRR